MMRVSITTLIALFAISTTTTLVKGNVFGSGISNGIGKTFVSKRITPCSSNDMTSTLTSTSTSIASTGKILNILNDIDHINSFDIDIDNIFSIRGGAAHEYDHDEYDDEYDEYDHEDEYDTHHPHQRQHHHHQRQRPQPHQRQRPPPPHQRQRPPPPHQHQRRRPPPPHQRNSRNNYKKQSSVASDIVSTTANIAHKSLNIATSATVSTLKNSGKAAFYLSSPKHVSKDEIYGIWRFDQCIGTSACAANIEFTFSGDAITRFDDGSSQSGYLFQSKSWPRSCSIEFEADAFQGVEDDRPVRYYYKGYFRRKLADKSVIKIVGKIYEVKKRFWKGKDGPGVAGVEVGSFVARKRMQATNQLLDDGEEYDDDYDDYDIDYGEYDY